MNAFKKLFCRKCNNEMLTLKEEIFDLGELIDQLMNEVDGSNSMVKNMEDLD